MTNQQSVCRHFTPVSSAFPSIGRRLASRVPFLEELAHLSVICCYRHDLLNYIYDFVIG